MPDAGIFFRRFETFSFRSMQVEYLRSFHILDITQNAGNILHIMPVYGTEIAYVHPLENILLLRNEGFQAIA